MNESPLLLAIFDEVVWGFTCVYFLHWWYAHFQRDDQEASTAFAARIHSLNAVWHHHKSCQISFWGALITVFEALDWRAWHPSIGWQGQGDPGLLGADISVQATGVSWHGEFLQEIHSRLCRHPSSTNWPHVTWEGAKKTFGMCCCSYCNEVSARRDHNACPS